jgi:hypothetical protein
VTGDLHEVMLGWLRRVARSPHKDRLVLRGSLLTSAWCPGRPAADVDHLVLGGFELPEGRLYRFRDFVRKGPGFYRTYRHRMRERR